MCVQATQYGMGRHNYYIPAEEQINAGRILYIVQPIWIWVVAFIKISMACMLLRILRSTIWRLFLYAMIGLVSPSTSSFMLILLLQYQPVSAFWNPDAPNVKCWGPLPAQIGLYSNAAVSIVTDSTLAVLLLASIHKMNPSFSQRAVIVLLMCMGLFATRHRHRQDNPRQNVQHQRRQLLPHSRPVHVGLPGRRDWLHRRLHSLSQSAVRESAETMEIYIW